MSAEVGEKIQALAAEINELESEIKQLDKLVTKKKTEKEALEFDYNLAKSAEFDRDWENESFEWDEKVLYLLRKVFRLKDFKANQKAAINLVLSKQCVLLLMPTGGGKSLCYQLPALCSTGITIVISPLISLMEDQVLAMKKLNINAIVMSSHTLKENKEIVYECLTRNIGDVKLVYTTPEWLCKSKKFLSCLQTCELNERLDRFAIDEIHCCSQWGHDFRPDYRFLSMLKSLFPTTAIIGLTATASNNVLIDVQRMLKIERCPILRAPFDRPNLNFTVVQKSDDVSGCISYLYDCISKKYEGKSGIIYTVTMHDAEDVAKALQSKHLKVAHYHSEMDKNRRLEVHTKWLDNHYQVIVATVAFGMGIDKPDVRFVIHYSVPKSLEALYQEAGRAGRNGDNADCIMIFKLADYIKQSGYAKASTQVDNCTQILRYSLNITDCRHYLLQKHFETTTKEYKCHAMCDNCREPAVVERYNLKKPYEQIRMIIRKAEDHLTLLKLLDKWYKGIAEKQVITKVHMTRIIGNLLLGGFLTEYRSYTAYTVHVYIRLTGESPNKFFAKLVKDNQLDDYFADEDLTMNLTETKRKRKSQ